ncbi:putative glucosaminylphosphatidylinositol acyltransferase [Blattamonas nauphoetae]|uniref:Glucosaminylphosphatidylinositol acyltransferase n=1 Tax=Blattamonas nauphoetae TaxID=2049346 RepID=A0ABQ9XQD4_9EUKA|nr:putative glucosaminylphosphatidylinositol acyltransferase [Blattamonas nauphoetae]
MFYDSPHWKIPMICNTAVFFFILLVCLMSGSCHYSPKKLARTLSSNKRKIIDRSRSFVSFQTTICIMGVDFPPNIPTLTKTTFFGRSYMDSGVILTVTNSGTVSHVASLARPKSTKPRTNYSFISVVKKMISDTWLLFFIGIVRYIMLVMSDYDYDATEYGRVWNFFFTLAFLRIEVLSLQYITNSAELGPLIISSIALFVYNICLCFFNLEGLYSAPRNDGFFYQNFEGILSLCSYPFVFFMSSYFTRIITSTKQNMKHHFQSILNLILVALFFFALTPTLRELTGFIAHASRSLNPIAFDDISTFQHRTEEDSSFSSNFIQLLFDAHRSFSMPPSRRMMNFRFVMEVVGYHALILAMGYVSRLFEFLVNPDFLPSTDSDPSDMSLFDYVFSKMQLYTFLFANLCIGPIHLLFDRPNSHNMLSNTLIICVYTITVILLSLIVCSVVFPGKGGFIGKKKTKTTKEH